MSGQGQSGVKRLGDMGSSGDANRPVECTREIGRKMAAEAGVKSADFAQLHRDGGT